MVPFVLGVLMRVRFLCKNGTCGKQPKTDSEKKIVEKFHVDVS